MATWTPARATSAICLAIEFTTSGTTPSFPPPNTSPDSFSTTRWQAGANGQEAGFGSVPRVSVTIPASSFVAVLFRSSWGSGADLEAGEPLHGHTGLVEHGLHGLLALGHRRLLEQDDVLEEAFHPALDDLRQRLLRLALLAGGRL